MKNAHLWLYSPYFSVRVDERGLHMPEQKKCKVVA